MTKSTKPSRTRRQLLLWEVAWIPCEMSGVGLGLFLGLGLDNWDGANFVLFGTVVVSALVRSWHYGRARTQPELAVA